MNHHQLPISETYKLLYTSKLGLPAAKAEDRQKQYGKNELTEKKKNLAFVLVLKQFKDVMIFILLLAAVISFSLFCIPLKTSIKEKITISNNIFLQKVTKVNL